MSFEPEKFFIGVIDFFAILLPGALLVFFLEPILGAHLLGRASGTLVGAQGWVAFLFASYLLGHFIFLVGSALVDPVYDRIRNATRPQLYKRLAQGKGLRRRLTRALARRLVKPDSDNALALAIRIKEHHLGPLEGKDAINAFQWSKARLMSDQAPALAAVQRFEADSKFFRSLVIVLVVLALLPVWGAPLANAVVAPALLVLAFWRYLDQRLKSTEQAYRYVLTREAEQVNGFRAPAGRPRRDPSHAGGVVVRAYGDAMRYLLVRSRDGQRWVLPKGHIEAGEREQETAVREVHEESGVWARVAEQRELKEIEYETRDEQVTVRFYLMAWLEDDRQAHAERAVYWSTLEEAIVRLEKLPESQALLREAAARAPASLAPRPHWLARWRKRGSAMVAVSRLFAAAVLAGSAWLAAGGPLAAQAASGRARSADRSRPNLVFILADDLGWGDVGAYGQKKIRTPNLDELAREGTRFTQFYAGTAVCAPSRSSLLTGQHTGHTPIRGNRAAPPIGQVPLPASALALATVLKRAGYATGAFGKWSLGGPGSEGAPGRHGFDEFFGYLDQTRAHYYYPEFLFHNEERVPLPNKDRPQPRVVGAGWPLVKGLYSQDTIANAALSFIERHRHQPFFLYVPFTIPHASLEVPDSDLVGYVDAQGRSIFPETPFPGNGYVPQPMPHAAYAAMVTVLDRDVGRILRKLKELGLDRNTIVLFTSDNGPAIEGGSDPQFFGNAGPFRGHKRDLYEGGIREPMIAWAPGRIPAGRVSDHPWAMWDVFPTLARLAGVDPGRVRAPGGIDGLSMVSLLTGKGKAPEHAYFYWEFHEQGGKQAVRLGNWKGVRLNAAGHLDAPIELYDLATDTAETRDVATRHPDIIRRMAAIMKAAHIPSPLFPDFEHPTQGKAEP